MLQNIVAGVSELNQVKTPSAHDVAHGGKPLTFDNYKTFLLSAASTYDSKRGFSQPKASRTIQLTDFGESYPNLFLRTLQMLHL